jgi:hypothetical protein
VGTPAWTIRMFIIFLLGSAEAFTESPRVMAHPMSRVRKVTDTRISVQPQFGARVKATAKVIERLDRIEIKTTGCSPGCARRTKRGQASHASFHQWSQRT